MKSSKHKDGKIRAVTYVENALWQKIAAEAKRKMTTESHIIRVALHHVFMGGK